MEETRIKIVDNKLVISIPIKERRSKSKKSLLIATTAGSQPTPVMYKGRMVHVNVNAYISLGKRDVHNEDDGDAWDERKIPINTGIPVGTKYVSRKKKTDDESE